MKLAVFVTSFAMPIGEAVTADYLRSTFSPGRRFHLGFAIEGVAVLDVMHSIGGAGDRTRPEHSTRWLVREIRIPLNL